jgi:alkylation response protein AidB-like acyl-CoA dehydrogenase
MDFALSEEQIELQKWAREFAHKEIRPVAAYYDEAEEFPWPVIAKAAHTGLYTPEFYTQAYQDPTGLTLPLVMEEIFWGCAGIGLAIFGTGLPLSALAAVGTPDQLVEWMPKMFGTPDAPRVSAFAVTEPHAGSDVRSLRTRARREGDEWILNGTKVFITNGSQAEVYVIVAAVDPELGHRGQASFVVPKGTPGLRQGKKESKLGIRASHTAEVVLEDCRVPAENLLGGMERLERKLERARSGRSSGRSSGALATFEVTRPTVGASAIGIAQAAYEWTLAYLDNGGPADPLESYLDESSTAGRPPVERQSVQQRLADVATEIEAARLLVQRASWMGRAGIPMTSGQGSMSKLKGGDVAMWATRTCMDLVGPYAWSTDCPLEKWFRDAKIYQLFEGTAEIQRLVISRMQVQDYRERLTEGAEIAAAARTGVAATANGAGTERRDGARTERRDGGMKVRGAVADDGAGATERETTPTG